MCGSIRTLRNWGREYRERVDKPQARWVVFPRAAIETAFADGDPAAESLVRLAKEAERPSMGEALKRPADLRVAWAHPPASLSRFVLEDGRLPGAHCRASTPYRSGPAHVRDRRRRVRADAARFASVRDLGARHDLPLDELAAALLGLAHLRDHARAAAVRGRARCRRLGHGCGWAATTRR